MWKSTTDWKPNQKALLSRYVENTGSTVDAGKRMHSGMPMLIDTDYGGRSRQKRKMKLAFAAEGTPQDPDKLRVHLGSTNVREVARGSVQPLQVRPKIQRQRCSMQAQG